MARIAETKEDKPAAKTPTPMTDDEMKAWVRAEIHLAANGVSEVERETMNP